VNNLFSNQTSSRRLNTVLYFIVAALCSSSIIFSYGFSHASESQEQTWSIRFNKVAVADIIKQLSQATGVEIYTNKTPNMERITRAYEDQTIEHIIRDALRGTNYTLVWHYGENQLESIGICFFDAGSGTSKNLSTDRNSGSNNRVARAGSTQRPPSYRKQVNQPKKALPRGLSASKAKSRSVVEDEGEDDDEDLDEEDEE
jgi:type II secretory pathway component GspD/PulD (secretin)